MGALDHRRSLTFAAADIHLRRLKTLARPLLEASSSERVLRAFILKTLLLASFWAGAFVLVYSLPSGWARVAAAFVLGLATVMFLTLAHDLSHRTVPLPQRLHDVLLSLFMVPIGIDGHLWALRHIRSHHPYTNIPGADPDISENSLVRLSPTVRWRPWHRFQAYYAPIVYLLVMPTAVWLEDLERIQNKGTSFMKAEPLRGAELARFLLLKGLHLAIWFVVPQRLFGASFAECALSYGLLMGWASLIFMACAGTNHYSEGIEFPMPGKDGRVHDSWARHQIAVNVDWSPDNKFLTWAFSGANTHVAHHLFPGASSRQLLALTRLVRDYAAREGLPYKRYSFAGALRAHFGLLRQLGAGP
jgi:linoleoyl-CoA desaturase